MPLPARGPVDIDIKSARSFIAVKEGEPRRVAVQLLAVEPIAR
jgi:hypothetical protein